MKKLFFTLLFLFFVYFSLQALFYFFGPGHNVNYEVNGFKIKEEYINKQKNENHVYNFTITNDNVTFYLQIFEDFDNESKIIKEIKSYSHNNVNCIMPIFDGDKSLTDLMCLKDEIVYNYRDSKNKVEKEKVEEFYQSLSKYLKAENLNSKDVKNTITLYKNNLQPSYYFSVVSYKGFLYANSTNKTLNAKNIFANDVYDNYLTEYVNKYFVTVNYDEQYGYSKIYIYDITNGKEEVKTLAKNIERNSYIQGIYKDSLYIFDRSNKIQYEINTDSMSVLEVGNVSTGIKVYKDGKFERVSAHECANKDVLFSNPKVEVGDYELIGSTDGIKTGYKYYAKKVGEEFEIYRTNKNSTQRTYLMNTKYLDKLLFINEYIYYVDDANIKYYSDHTGIRTLANNTELNFNQNIEYQIFYQE